MTFQLFGSALGWVLTIGGGAFGTFSSIATGISKADSVSKYLFAKFKDLIPIHPLHAAEAEEAIKSIDLDDVQKLVEAQMKNLTDPLKVEIQATTSW